MATKTLLAVLGLVLLAGASVSADTTSHELECMACNDAINFADYLLNSTFVKGSLKILLGSECTKLPPQYVPGCNATVYGAFDMLVGDIIGFLDLACQQPPLSCPPPTAAKFAATATSRLSDAPGGICGVMENIYKNIPSDVDYFKIICSQISEQYASSCKDMFATHKADIVNMAQNLLKKFVSEIPFVDCTLTAAADELEQLASSHDLKSDVCDVLDSAQSQLPSVLPNLRTVCLMMSPESRAECEAKLSQKTPLFVALSEKIVELAQGYAHCGTNDDFNVRSAVCNDIKKLEAEIVHLVTGLEKVCEILPGNALKKDCHNFIANSGHQVESFIDNLLNEVGKIFKCEGQSISKNEIYCVLFRALRRALPKVVKTASKICTALPKGIDQTYCHSLFDQYSGALLNLLTAALHQAEAKFNCIVYRF